MKKNKYIIFTAMGFELVGLIVAAVILGKMVDDHYQTKGLALISFSVLSLAGWLTHIIALAKSIEKSAQDKNE